MTFAQNEVWMHPNAGQWDDRIEYKIDLHIGEMLIEKDGFTYYLHDGKINMSGHNHSEEEHHENEDSEIHAQVIKQKFIGSSWAGQSEKEKKSSYYRNYLLGNDKSKWKSELCSYASVIFNQLYPGIDLMMDGTNGVFKYSLRIAANADASIIEMNYEGHSGLEIDKQGNLLVKNRFGEIQEEHPIAWQETDKGRKKVDVEFLIEGNSVKFLLPHGYDNTKELIIDPSLTFSTFSGATSDNWGFTAAPDQFGRVFGGGIVFGVGYPTTLGAFDTSFNGGQLDVGITKFTADGTSLIYSTFIGGNGTETPNSIVSAPNGELYILGITSSSNFPMAGTPFDNTFGGGPLTGSTNGLNFDAGTDLYVARLNPLGTALMASTFVGGSDIDGLNLSNLKFNYGDQYRGEIILDAAGNVYVASNTKSTDFPIVMGAQGSLNGSYDAVVFKMNSNLSTMLWSTYFGGPGEEAGNSVQIAQNGDVFVAGGTNSSSMPFPFGNDLSNNGGVDGYVARFNGINGNILSGTYIGANEYDQAFFVQLDVDDQVYVLGQSESNLGIVGASYGVANSGQFIWKFDHNLNSILWKTMVGAGTGHVEISPTAFLVSDCYDIYLSGWGGYLNQIYSQAINSTTNGFPVTPDAFQLTTSGSNFWIAVLGQDASSLKYASYMGGMSNISHNHVDGGTSRFDKSGKIYHAVCGSCGNTNTGFTTTPGVWSPTSQSSNCNMAVFKFELSTIEAVVADPNPVVCLPNPVIFNNNSANGNDFFWDFGDNTTSTDVNPTHLYQSAGNYTVTLIVSDTNGCFTPDSIEFLVVIGDFQGGIVQPPGPVCPGEQYQLEAFGGVNFEWSPAQYLDDPTIATPTATVFQTTDFMVIISDTCGIDTAYVTLPVFTGTAAISNDTSICIGNSVQLFASGGDTYVWSPPTYLDDASIATPLSTPTNTVTYAVEITTVNGCVMQDTVTIDVYFTPPIPVMPEELPLCEGSSADITVSGGDTYLWSPDIDISTLIGPTVTVNPSTSLYYYCDFTNACGTVTDSVYVDVVEAMITAGNDTIVCPGQSATLWATGGVWYNWSPPTGLNNTHASLVTATPNAPTVYYVTGMDVNGCVSMDSVFVELYPPAFIQTSPDVHAFFGDLIQLSATSSTPGPYVWSPAEFLSCVVCTNPVANPEQNYTYVVTYTDANGCSASDSVNIYYDPIIYVPNTFTPGSDNSINPYFKAEGGNINEFELLIFDRWGELIFTGESIDDVWDGTYEGNDCQDGTYVWKIRLTDFLDKEYNYVGHINLLR